MDGGSNWFKKKKKGKNGSLVEIVYSLIKIDLES